jgi:uncharacterized membrane protein YdbT with pleckstrin-like domain
MSYVAEALQSGETVRHEARISWALYVGAIVGFAVGLGLLVAWLATRDETVLRIGAVLALFGGAGIVHVFVTRRTTEVAVTDRRLIYKTGLLNRKAIEMNLDKVESVDIRQSLLGRLFGYGDVVVRGTGMGMEPICGVDEPLELRDSIAAAIHK